MNELLFGKLIGNEIGKHSQILKITHRNFLIPWDVVFGPTFPNRNGVSSGVVKERIIYKTNVLCVRYHSVMLALQHYQLHYQFWKEWL